MSHETNTEPPETNPPVGRHAADDVAPKAGQNGVTPTHTEGKHLATHESADGDASSHGTASHGTTPEIAPTDTGATATAKGKKKTPLLALIIALPIVVALMLLAFATPAVHSGAKDLPITLSGPSQAVSQVEKTLESKAPGTFDVTTHDTEQQATDAIKDRDAVGGISLGKDGVTVLTAGGAGSPYAPILKNIGAGLEKQGQKVTYTDVAPLPAKDTTGSAMTSAGLPIIFGGMATAAAMFFSFRGSFGRRAIGVISVAVLAGAVAAFILHTWLDATTGDYWHLWAAFTMGMMAISFTVLGLAKNLGTIGFALGAVIMLFISNPISGLATGPQWLPHPWGTIGQYLPVGAAGTALRSAAYFDGRGATHAWIVLACWAIGGAILLALGKARKTGH